VQARDIFTNRFLDREPTLVDLLSALPWKVASKLLGESVSNGAQITASVSKKPTSEADKLFEVADLVLHANRLEKEDVEELARANSVSFSASDSSYAILSDLIQVHGVRKVEALLMEKLKPTAIARTGSFAEFAAPGYDLGDFKPLQFITTLETALENMISVGAKERRLVKVRPEQVDNTLYVGVYYQRPHVDGRRIARDKKGKRVTADMFEQGAGSTYFLLRPGKNRSRITFKSPEAKLTRYVRDAVGQTVWSKTNAISEKPAISYDLSVFKDPNFSMDVLDKFKTKVADVLMSEIHVRAQNGNLITVKAPGRRGNAFDDFHEIAKRARVLVQEAEITRVVLKFVPVDDGRSLAAHVEVQPDKLRLDDTEWKLVNAHLKAWGVIRD
jgi:hypothetical protein